MVGIGVPEMENRNFAGLTDNLAHPIGLPSRSRSIVPPGTDLVVTVRSHMKARIGGCASSVESSCVTSSGWRFLEVFHITCNVSKKSYTL